jgi:hypothetical protein
MREERRALQDHHSCYCIRRDKNPKWPQNRQVCTVDIKVIEAIKKNPRSSEICANVIDFFYSAHNPRQKPDSSIYRYTILHPSRTVELERFVSRKSNMKAQHHQET